MPRNVDTYRSRGKVHSKRSGKTVVKMPMPGKGETVYEDHTTGEKGSRPTMLKRGGKRIKPIKKSDTKKTLNKAQPPGGSTKAIRDKMYRTDI